MRAQGLVADTTTTLDLTDVVPIVPIKPNGPGAKLWTQLQEATPFWWTEDDIPAASMLCLATDWTTSTLRNTSATPAGKAAMLKEWRNLAGELGLSPTARGRLKLTEAQSSIAAKRVEAFDDERARDRVAIDIDELDLDD